MSNINDQILESIDIIVDKKIENLKFDKTIEAVVIEIVDAEQGKYRIRYKDSILLLIAMILKLFIKQILMFMLKFQKGI